jgi:hypothetical protein
MFEYLILKNIRYSIEFYETAVHQSRAIIPHKSNYLIRKLPKASEHFDVAINSMSA